MDFIKQERTSIFSLVYQTIKLAILMAGTQIQSTDFSWGENRFSNTFLTYLSIDRKTKETFRMQEKELLELAQTGWKWKIRREAGLCWKSSRGPDHWLSWIRPMGGSSSPPHPWNVHLPTVPTVGDTPRTQPWDSRVLRPLELNMWLKPVKAST